MKINTYPEGDFGSINYKFRAIITEADVEGMFMLPERRNDYEMLVGVMKRNNCIGVEFPVNRGNTFTETMFRGFTSPLDREVYERNREQVKSIVRRANLYVDSFIDKFYGGTFLRDNRRIQTFNLDLSWHGDRIPGYDKEWTEEPYMPPVLNDWQPPVMPKEIPDATPFVPPAVKTVMDMVREITTPKV